MTLNAHAILLTQVVDMSKNFTTIYDNYGTLDEFKEMLKRLHEKDIKVLIDFVPNHTSDDNPWFELSKNKKSPFRDFYLWTEKPNTWVCVALK